MAYNQELAERIRPLLAEMTEFDEKKMFGGVGYMVKGNMCCGIYKDSLILRLSVEMAEQALQLDHCRVFDITGRPMKGWVMVAPEAWGDDSFLKAWLKNGYNYCISLPPK